MSSSRREQRKKQTQEAVLQAAANGRHPDDDAKRKAIMDVVQLWLDRLQLISVIVSAVDLYTHEGCVELRVTDVLLRFH